jgi:hypothetical protein
VISAAMPAIVADLAVEVPLLVAFCAVFCWLCLAVRPGYWERRPIGADLRGLLTLVTALSET